MGFQLSRAHAPHAGIIVGDGGGVSDGESMDTTNITGNCRAGVEGLVARPTRMWPLTRCTAKVLAAAV